MQLITALCVKGLELVGEAANKRTKDHPQAVLTCPVHQYLSYGA